jgi:hypothetical protein
MYKINILCLIQYLQIVPQFQENTVMKIYIYIYIYICVCNIESIQPPVIALSCS